jgi:carbamoyl-phosphate synthase large subunit
MDGKPEKVLVLGSGALKIGEAGEFDYSGSQAIKALREDGITTVLVNPNIATIQTSEYLANQVYFLPVTRQFVEGVIERERPDGILLGFGGQTALNCGLELDEHGVLRHHGVRVLGTPIEAIRATEDRDLFARRLTDIGVKVPRSAPATSVDGAVKVADQLGFPVMLRAGYALGGLGSGVCANAGEVRERAGLALAHSGQVLIEDCLAGWKEVEYEVVRDQFDNCITVCNMENLDPLGIHTGESIVVTPSQTLTNQEYHLLRQIAIRVVRHLEIVGECNIQFALDPHSADYRVIEVNARLSRSSALASKATGYPLALVAAKLALGGSLPELRNSITGATTACFEPALDYVVVKVPRWDLQKFPQVSRRIGSGMKSVGEVMAIGVTFEEALQKALRMLDVGATGLVGRNVPRQGALEAELAEPTPGRIFAIAAAIQRGMSLDRIHELSGIDRWFLLKVQRIVEVGERLRACGEGAAIPRPLMREAKCTGFADRQIAEITGQGEEEVRAQREAYGIRPRVRQIDTLAAEYPARTNYLYLTYRADEDDVESAHEESVIVLGSGAYCIGSSVEFDWCAVNTVLMLGRMGYRTIIINYNPETVSTDYNECDRLYFDELSLESVLAIYERERPLGVVVSMGGQIPNRLAIPLHRAGVTILGTSALSIDTAEDRHTFSRLLDTLGIEQPEWKELVTVESAQAFAERVGYPVLVRPSYVLSGAAMGVASDARELSALLDKATQISSGRPVMVSKFIENAKELEIDAVACRGEVCACAITEHVENAGVHSGDATLVLPPQRTYLETIRRIKRTAERIARALDLHGPFNIQFIAKGNAVKVIECNVRASRSFPFVSKIVGTNLVALATEVMMGRRPTATGPMNGSMFDLNYVGVKAPQFSFTRLDGADPTLGVEMASTGEVACLGDDFEEAFLKALLAVGYRVPIHNVLLSTGPVEAKAAFLEASQQLRALGLKLYATKGTAQFLRAHGIHATVLHWPLEHQRRPNVLDYLGEKRIDLVINIPKNSQEEELTNDYIIRRRTVDFGIPLITNIQLAQRFVEALARKGAADLQVKSWREYVDRPNLADELPNLNHAGVHHIARESCA